MGSLSPEDVEVWGVPTLAARLRDIAARTPFGALARTQLELLRIGDIAAYIGATKRALMWDYDAAARNYQRELTWFFRLWDAGRLVKVESDSGWQVVRSEGLAKVALSSPPKKSSQHRLRVDFQKGRLTWR